MFNGANGWFRSLARLLRPDDGPSWALSPYPDGKSFGFTIVHDADSAYSRRLAPIMDAFDELGLKITVTVFPLWAAWASDPVSMWKTWRERDPFFAPVAVPLEDHEECQFYLELHRRGHEIAMHSPSETSSLRADLIRSFELFEAVFGVPPRTYVEHSPDNNLDAQCRCGSDPESPYYNTDLLNLSGCWVWVCDDETAFSRVLQEQFDVLSDRDGPFCPRAREKFGIHRAFLRSPTKPSNGNGFLAAFNDRTFDSLQEQGGLAIVYTHLAMEWLDAETRRLRADIAECLSGLMRRNVWCAPVATILDRFSAIRQVEVRSSPTRLDIANHSNMCLAGVTIAAPPGYSLVEAEGVLQRLPGDLVVLGDFQPGVSRTFTILKAAIER